MTLKAARKRLIVELIETLKFVRKGYCDFTADEINLFASELLAIREMTLQKDFMNIDEACAELGGISHATFYNWIGRRRLPEGKKKKEVVVWNKKDIENAKQYMK